MTDSIGDTDEWINLPIDEDDYVRVNVSPVPNRYDHGGENKTEETKEALQITIPSPGSSTLATMISSDCEDDETFHNSINKLSVGKLHTPVVSIGSSDEDENENENVDTIQWLLNMLGIKSIPITFVDFAKLFVVSVGACTLLTSSLMYVHKRLFSADSKRIE